jgi:CRISPR/Cas system-associated exonuclease Cas4 (RecB family)
VLITVPAGDEATRRAVAGLARAGEGSGADGGPGRAPDGAAGAADSELARVRAYLFSPRTPPEASPRGDVVFFSAPGEGREAVEIARLILEEARAGTPFDRMAVLLRAPTTHSGLLESALGRAGVPAFFARGTRRPDAAGRAFLALLDCARERLSALRFAEYLSLGQVPLLDAAGAPGAGRAAWVAAEDELLTPSPPPAEEEGDDTAAARPDSDDEPVVEGTLRAPWKWEELLVESAVIGGVDRWARRLAGLEAEMQAHLAEVRKEEPESARAQAIARDLLNLAHLRRFAMPVIERLSALPDGAAWGAWIPALEELAPAVLRRPERVLAALAELRPLAPVGPVSLDEVRDILGPRLASLEQRPPADRYGRVFVGAVAEVRGRAFDVVFLPGLAERVFPQKPREDPILLDALRERLGAGLALQHDRSQEERLLLRLAAGAATRRLYLSYARIDLAVARPRVPSFYALEVRRALAGRIPDPHTMELEAQRAAGARLAWPAPVDMTRAVDEEEHDLAALFEVLRRPAAEARGRARYLLELNAPLARSLRTRWMRWEHRRWTPHDGIVRLADGTRPALAAASPRARAYSVSALQKYAVCPYQFFLSAICRLEPRKEVAPLERLDPATRGKIFHEVQAEALRALARTGRLPIARGGLGEAMTVLDETFARVAEKYREELAPAIARVWQGEIDSMRIDLRVWLEKSAEIQAEWEPIAFELAFGLPAHEEFDPRSVAAEVLIGEYRMRGVIDVIEARPGGQELRVTDYKTGGNYSKWRMVVGGGETLQPVLYGLVAERVLGRRVVEGRLFYCTRDGGFSDRVVTLDDRARDAGAGVLASIDRAIDAGFLPPAPRPRACDICDFRVVCGPAEERRAQAKDRAPLAPLLALRDTP